MIRRSWRTKASAALRLAACTAAASIPAAAQDTGSPSFAQVEIPGARPLASDRVVSRAIETLDVTAPAFGPDGAIPPLFTALGKNVSFPLAWSGGPPGVRSWVVVVEDPDAPTPAPLLHWLVYNIPEKTTEIGRGVHNVPQGKPPRGFMQGHNGLGGIGYVGPNPPAGDPPHHYHVEVFGLSKALHVAPGAGLAAVIAAMHGKVLAEGETVGVFAAPAASAAPRDPALGGPPKPRTAPKGKAGPAG